MAEKRDFFISFTKTDKQWAEWIAWQLKNAGYSVLIQSWDFVPGSNFVAQMDEALINSKRYIIVLSPEYLVSEYCTAEWTAAFTKDPVGSKATFIPVRVKKCEPEGLLAPIVFINLFDEEEDEARKRLLEGVNPPGSPPVKPEFPGRRSKGIIAPDSPRFPGFPVNNLPYTRNPLFTGREGVLDSIHKGFESGEYISLTQSVEGLGGVGKTQIVLEYAYRFASNYDTIWWVGAESFETIIKAFAEFAQKYGLVGKEVIEKAPLVEAVKSWMMQHKNWLFIFDNAEEPDSLDEYLPGINTGNILVTSRHTGWRKTRNIDIDVFKPDEAASFLTRSTGIADITGAEVLAAELGYLPLALEQAAAYISNTQESYEGYLELYNKYKLDIFKGKEAKPGDYDKTVAVTWNVSIDKIKNESAKQLLNICSFFAPDNINRDIFPMCAEFLPEPLASDVKNKLKYNRLITELMKYSLIRKQHNTFSIHRLLQEAVRNTLEEDLWQKCSLYLIYKLFLFDYDNTDSWDFFSSLVPHALSIAEYAEKANIGLAIVGRLNHEAGLWFTQIAVYSEAILRYMKGISIFETIYEEGHILLVPFYNNISIAFNKSGDYRKGLEWSLKALEIQKRNMKEGSEEIAGTYSNIAGEYFELGDHQKALEWLLKSIEIIGKREDLDAASVYNNIGILYKNKGEYSKALEMYQKTLEIEKKILKKDHPATALTYHNIANLYRLEEEYEQAIEFYKKALEIYEDILGREHPDTAIIYSGIGDTLYYQGHLEDALKCIIKALKIYIKKQMLDNPNALQVLERINFIYYSTGGQEEDFLKWLEEKLNENDDQGKNNVS